MLSKQYLAGIMDADGHFTWRGKKYRAPDIGVTNTSAQLMEALGELGGSVSIQRRAGESKYGIAIRKDIYKWHLTGYRAVLVIEAIAPFLLVKKEKALECASKYREALSQMERPGRRLRHMKEEQEIVESWGWD